MKLFKFSALVCGSLASLNAWPLGLGPLRTESALNEPFLGHIDIFDARASDFDNFQIGLAPVARFEAAGIPFNRVLLDLNFDLVGAESGAHEVRVTTVDPVREPMLDFLVELNWSAGQLVREFTVLLDPPTYVAANAPTPILPPVPAPEVPMTPLPAPTPRKTAPIEIAAVSNAPVPTREALVPRVRDGGYGPIRSGETLYSVARRLKPAGIDVNQMMLALYRANPGAFIRGNINVMMEGSTLRIPSSAEASRLSPVEARREVEARIAGRAPAPAPAPKPVAPVAKPVMTDKPVEAPPQVVTAPEVAPSPAPSEAPEAPGTRLRLVAPEEGEGASNAAESDATGEGPDADLTLLQEELDARRQENRELADKLAETAEIIKLLTRQLEFKDTELATLQQQVMDLRNAVSAEGADETEAALAAASDEAAALQATDQTTPAEAMVQDADAVSAEDAELVADAALEPSEALSKPPGADVTADGVAAEVALGVDAADEDALLDAIEQELADVTDTASDDTSNEAPAADAAGPRFPAVDDISDDELASLLNLPDLDTPDTTAARPEVPGAATTTATETSASAQSTVVADTTEAAQASADEGEGLPVLQPEDLAESDKRDAAVAPEGESVLDQGRSLLAKVRPMLEQARAGLDGLMGNLPGVMDSARRGVDGFGQSLESRIPPHILALVPGGLRSLVGGAVLVLLLLLLLVRRLGARRDADTVIQASAPATPKPVTERLDTTIEQEMQAPATATAIATEAEPEADAQDEGDELARTLTEDELAHEELDPLEEMNVYLAYERFDQAEELVREAIEREPDVAQYRLRLLEVFYSANDKKKYEDAARDLLDLVGPESEQWASALAMWSEMSPNRALFSDTDLVATMGETGASTSFVDLTRQAETHPRTAAPDFVDVTNSAAETIDLSSLTSTGDLETLATGDTPSGATASQMEMLDITGGDVPDMTEQEPGAELTEPKPQDLPVAQAGAQHSGLQTDSASAQAPDAGNILEFDLEDTISPPLTRTTMLLEDTQAPRRTSVERGMEAQDTFTSGSTTLPETGAEQGRGPNEGLFGKDSAAEEDDHTLDFDIGTLSATTSADLSEAVSESPEPDATADADWAIDIGETELAAESNFEPTPEVDAGFGVERSEPAVGDEAGPAGELNPADTLDFSADLAPAHGTSSARDSIDALTPTSVPASVPSSVPNSVFEDEESPSASADAVDFEFDLGEDAAGETDIVADTLELPREVVARASAASDGVGDQMPGAASEPAAEGALDLTFDFDVTTAKPEPVPSFDAAQDAARSTLEAFDLELPIGEDAPTVEAPIPDSAIDALSDLPADASNAGEEFEQTRNLAEDARALMDMAATTVDEPSAQTDNAPIADASTEMGDTATDPGYFEIDLTEDPMAAGLDLSADSASGQAPSFGAESTQPSTPPAPDDALNALAEPDLVEGMVDFELDLGEAASAPLGAENLDALPAAPTSTPDARVGSTAEPSSEQFKGMGPVEVGEDSLSFDVFGNQGGASAGVDLDFARFEDEDGGAEGLSLDDTGDFTTQLNLARAYIELGDHDGARSILSDVRNKGTEQEKTQAIELLGRLG